MQNPFKYGIKKEIENYPPDKRPIKRRKICEQLKISGTTLSQWENIKISDPREISADDLAKISVILDCSIQKLMPNSVMWTPKEPAVL